MMDLREDRQAIAEGIALEAKAVLKCEYHEDCILEVGCSMAEQDAYKIAAARFKRGDYSDLFSSQRELTDLVKEVVHSAAESCYSCDKF